MSDQTVNTAQQSSTGARWNRMSIGAAALTALSLGGFVLTGVAGLVVFQVVAGHASLRQIRQRGERGSGLSWAALIIGYAFALWSAVTMFRYAGVFVLQLLQQ